MSAIPSRQYVKLKYSPKLRTYRRSLALCTIQRGSLWFSMEDRTEKPDSQILTRKKINGSNGNHTILSAAQCTDVALMTLTMSMYVPGTPSYFHERSLIFCMTLSRYHIRYQSRESFSGKRAWTA